MRETCLGIGQSRSKQAKKFNSHPTKNSFLVDGRALASITNVKVSDQGAKK